MRIVLFLFLAFLSVTVRSFGQTTGMYITDKGYIKFFSDAPLEDIEAHNHKVKSVLNANTGKLIFEVQVNQFKFENSLMQEHFNENYMESHKYPISRFTGKVSNMTSVNLTQNGIYPVDVEGDLTIHGVTKKITTKGTLEVSSPKVIAKAKFPVRVADYKIEVPSMVVSKVAEVVEITVEMPYLPAK